MQTTGQDKGHSRESRLPTPPEGGKGDGAAGAPPPLTSGGAQALGLIVKELPTNSADEAKKQRQLLENYHSGEMDCDNRRFFYCNSFFRYIHLYLGLW